MQCGAKTRNGTPCRTHAIRGAARCRMHGSANRESREKAASVIATERAARTAQRRGITPVTDPLGELLQLAGEVRAVKDVLAAKVEQGGPAAMAYERSLDRVHRVLADIARLNIEERLARLQGAVVEELVGQVQRFAEKLVIALGHDPEDPQVRIAVAESLQEMARRANGVERIPRVTSGYRPGPRVIEP